MIKKYLNTITLLYLNMNEKKYILATITIPIEINEDKSFEPIPEYMNMNFKKIDELPIKPESCYNQEFIKKQIYELILSTKKTDSIQVTNEELQKRNKHQYKKNVTFRNKNYSCSRYSRKVPFMVMDKDADLYE
jgi:hypothetical protein